MKKKFGILICLITIVFMSGCGNEIDKNKNYQKFEDPSKYEYLGSAGIADADRYSGEDRQLEIWVYNENTEDIKKDLENSFILSRYEESDEQKHITIKDVEYNLYENYSFGEESYYLWDDNYTRLINIISTKGELPDQQLKKIVEYYYK